MKLLTRPTISSAWAKASKLPLGNRVFSRLIGRMAPYTGTIGAVVLELGDGHSVVELQDKPSVRNHLRSVHATALVTLGEMASGLALMSALPPRMRAIVTRLEIDYLKKARGLLTAHGSSPVPRAGEKAEHIVRASIVDAAGDEVAVVRVTWLTGPEKD